VLAQDYPGEREIILALGNSSDGTNELVAAMAAADPRIRWVDNPANDVPVGLNLAIRAGRFPVVIRVDAHSGLPADYTRVMVGKLADTGAANVGGLMRARGDTPLQAAIARAYNSPFGMGGGAYHGGSQEGPAASAYLGVYRREVFEQIGYFDEGMRRAQDWELNSRIRDAGYLVWFTPEVSVDYWPRDSLDKLRKQMYATGAWRGHLARRGRSQLKHFAPPALVIGLLVSTVSLLGGTLGRRPGVAAAGAALPGAYAAGLAVVAARMEPGGWLGWWLNAVVLSCVHLSWGAGFIHGFCFGAESTVDRSRRQ
jgi:hypothetical protein